MLMSSLVEREAKMWRRRRTGRRQTRLGVVNGDRVSQCPFVLTVLDAERLAGVDDVAEDEYGVGGAQHDEQLVEGVPELGPHHDGDGDEVARQPEQRHHRRGNAVGPETPRVEGL